MEFLLPFTLTILLIIILIIGITFRITSREVWYSSLMAIVKSREAKIANREILRQALYKRSIVEALSTLAYTSIGSYLSKRVTEEVPYHTLESMLWLAYANDLQEIEGVLKGLPRKVYEAFIYRYDIYNIKSIVRSIVFKHHEVTLIPIGNLVKPESIERYKGIKSISELVRELEARDYRDEAKLIRNYAKQMEVGDIEAIKSFERELMRYWYSRISSVVSEVNDPILIDTVKVLMDMDYILSIIRLIHSKREELKGNIVTLEYIPTLLTLECRRRLIEAKSVEEVLSILQQTPYRGIVEEIVRGDFHRDPLLLDTALKTYFIKYILSTLLGDIFSLRPLVSYLLLKELEVHMLMFIFKVISLNLPREGFERVIHMYPL